MRDDSKGAAARDFTRQGGCICHEGGISEVVNESKLGDSRVKDTGTVLVLLYLVG